jgi:hypothetical protein
VGTQFFHFSGLAQRIAKRKDIMSVYYTGSRKMKSRRTAKRFF